MDAKMLAKIALRVLAVYTVVTVIDSLFSLIRFVGDKQLLDFESLWLLLSFITPLVVGLLLWRLAPGLASRTTDDAGAEKTGASFSATELQTIAFVTLGVFILIQSIAVIMGTIYSAIADAQPAGYPSPFHSYYFF